MRSGRWGALSANGPSLPVGRNLFRSIGGEQEHPGESPCLQLLQRAQFGDAGLSFGWKQETSARGRECVRHDPVHTEFCNRGLGAEREFWFTRERVSERESDRYAQEF